MVSSLFEEALSKESNHMKQQSAIDLTIRKLKEKKIEKKRKD